MRSVKICYFPTMTGINVQKEERAFFGIFPLSINNLPVIPLTSESPFLPLSTA